MSRDQDALALFEGWDNHVKGRRNGERRTVEVEKGRSEACA